ncbi:MAG: RNA polymerase sigma factor region1.1 domain-containing protein, partial [Acidimicrobiales bacterium]
MPTPFTTEGGPTDYFVALLQVGRERGYLTPEDLMSVLEQVELTPELIDAIVGRVRAEGIGWREDPESEAEEESDAPAGGKAHLNGSSVPVEGQIATPERSIPPVVSPPTLPT